MSEPLGLAAPLPASGIFARAANRLRKGATSLMTWRHLLVWYGATVVTGSLGSYFTYTSPLTSDAWQNWDPIRHPWAVDAVRLFIGAVLALFVLWALGAVDRHNQELRQQMLAGWLVLLPLLILAFVITVTFSYLPRRFIAELAARKWDCPITFRSIYVPYFPYAAYTIALTFGVVMLPFLLILARVRTDFVHWHGYRAEFKTAFAALPGKRATEDTLVAAQVALQNYIVRLKQVGERSLSVILAVAAMLVYEQATPSHNTTLQETQSWAKVVLWFFMGPAVISCITIVTFGYQSAIRIAENIYRRLLAKGWGDAKLQTTLLKARDDLMWKGNGGSFVVSILKSTGVLFVLIASSTAYVVKTANGVNGWWTIFIPDPVFDFLRQVFS